MSIRIMTAVWDAQRYEAGTLLVLLAMADYANDEDHTCHPSIGRLAQKSRLSERQVSRILVRLKDDGVISPVGEKPTTQGRPIVVYRINTDALSKGDISAAKGDTMSPLEMAKGDISAAKGDIGDTLNMTPMSYDPSEEPSIEPSVEEGAGTAQPAAAAEPPAWYEAEPPAPANPPTPPTVRSLTQQPPIAMYRDAFLRYPSKPQMALIMGHGIDDLRRWRAVLALWCGRGWALTNIAGMLDLYDHPERLEERQRPPQPASTARPAPPATPGADPVWQQSWDEWIAELSRPAGLGD
ncbi:MAG: helix-turn-helix domain-containing protein [Caldilineaceae bacterium]|nr:helix-turn-helix domain-containing protein [Caldilineaceae bacterium]